MFKCRDQQKSAGLPIFIFCLPRKSMMAFFCQLLKLLHGNKVWRSFRTIRVNSSLVGCFNQVKAFYMLTLKVVVIRRTYLWSRCARISPPGKAAFVVSKATLMACFHVPPMLSALVFDFVCPGSSIGKEYPEMRWPAQIPSFLQYFSDKIDSKRPITAWLYT